MPGVGGWFDATGEDHVVARTFSFHMQTPGGQPDQRIEPMEGAGELGEPLHESIAATNVGQFVEEDGLELLLVPCDGLRRQHEPWPPDAPDYGDGALFFHQ